MMRSLASDEEKFEQFKEWFRENGVSLVLGVAVGLGGVYGWRGWQSYQVTEAQRVSVELDAVEQHLDVGEYETAATQAEKLVNEIKSGLNADMSRLLLARARVEQGSLDQAIEPLKEIIADKKSMFRPLASLRLVRVYLAESNFDQAQQLIATNAGNVHAYALEEIRGDLESARGKYAAARAAYLSSMELVVGDDAGTRLLQMKLDALPAAE